MTMSAHAYTQEDPRYQTAGIKEKLTDVSNQARETIEKVNDARAKILLRTTADLITGLKSAYEDYESTHHVSKPSTLKGSKSHESAPQGIKSYSK